MSHVVTQGSRFLAVLAGSVLLTGCVSLYSVQNYGPTGAIGMITPGKSTMTEVIKGYGAPDAVYTIGNSDVYIFKSRRGRCFLGIYSDVAMKDVVIVANQEVVREVIEAEKGEAMAVLGMVSPILPVGNMVGQ